MDVVRKRGRIKVISKTSKRDDGEEVKRSEDVASQCDG